MKSWRLSYTVKCCFFTLIFIAFGYIAILVWYTDREFQFTSHRRFARVSFDNNIIKLKSICPWFLYIYLSLKSAYRCVIFLLCLSQAAPSELYLQHLMTSVSNKTAYPISELYSMEYNFLHFYHLPKRKVHVEFTEITSANRWETDVRVGHLDCVMSATRMVLLCTANSTSIRWLPFSVYLCVAISLHLRHALF